MGFRSYFLYQTVTTPQNLQNKKQDYSLSYPLAMYCERWLKMTILHEGGNVEGEKPLRHFFFC